MRGFVKSFVIPLLAKRRWTRVCEIGASRGSSTDLLTALPTVGLTVIDPCLDCDLNKKFAGNKNVTVKKGTSLEVLPELSDAFDCVLIDGDHNWYTVFHELSVISDRHLLKPGGMVFFHDVGWPYGRRDMYYQPELIPQEYRHRCAQKGIVEGQSELSALTGTNLELWNATHEGGARNGVLTAIEDFLREHKDEYKFLRVREEFGLGIMYRRKNVTYDFGFLAVECKGLAHTVLAWPKRSAKAHFTSAFSLAKSLLARPRPSLRTR